MFTKLHSIHFGRDERGMSLVELMVAMAIGLIGITIMFQIYSVTETRKRNIAGTSDTDVSGRIALVALQHDIQLAGYGFSEGASTSVSGGAIFGCTVNAADSKPSAHTLTFPLTPLIIQDGGNSGKPDQIIALRGSSSLMATSKPITHISDDSWIAVPTSASIGIDGVQPGDLVAAVNIGTDQPFECALYEITSETSGTLYLYHAIGGYTDAYAQSRTARYNGAANLSIGTSTNGRLYDLGPRLLMSDDNNAPTRVYRNIWAISDGSTSYKDASSNTIEAGKLVVTNDLDQVQGTQTIADGVINMQAQYGYWKDANGDGTFTPNELEWVNCDSGSSDTTPDICKTANLYSVSTNDDTAKLWANVRAIRIAILMRGEYDQATVTTSPTWLCTGSPCDFGQFMMSDTLAGVSGLDGTRGDWHHYRYNIFETVITLKNIAWGSLVQ